METNNIRVYGPKNALFGRNNFAFAIFVPNNGIIIINENLYNY